jgi:DNA-binding transcriptional MerR regulator
MEKGMPDATHQRLPQEVAARLEIPGATLRRWSEEFAEYLSIDHKQQGGYSDEDLATLITIKGLMAEGLTHDQVRQKLSEARRPDGATPGGLVAAGTGLPLAPAVAFMADALHNMTSSQQAVLNSQAANRELLGVVLQDNFNLKEENARLRERMLELERQMTQLRRDEEARRESLRWEMEARVQDLQHMVALQSRSGCLGGLFGSSRG